MGGSKNSRTRSDLREAGRKYNTKRPQYSLALRLISNISDKRNKKVLDVGSGMGEFADLLRESGFSVVCVDGDNKCYRNVLKKDYESYKVDLETQLLPFPDGKFDIVVSLEVIEHLWDTEKYLSEINRVLRLNGYAIFTTPNYNCWNFRIKSLLGKFEKFTYKSRHKKFYTAKSFRRELESHFTIEEIIGMCALSKIGFNNKSLINLLSLHVGALCKKTISLRID